MANSRKSKPSRAASAAASAPVSLLSLVDRRLRDAAAGGRLVAALSGGIDSVVLLDILDRLAGRRGFRLGALHVNHQISPNARRWEAFCRALCRQRGIALRVVRAQVRRGNSLEAAAREARYAAFQQARADSVVLAHNRDDQAETVLLQLLRGGGLRGAAGMPLARQAARAPAGGARQRPAAPRILRPLLEAPRSAIERYARRRGLNWIEDESNDDPHFARNFVRQEVLPLIARRFPSCGAVLARSAGQFAEAAHLLDALAMIDGGGLEDGVLRLPRLRALPHARAKNVLRHFLSMHGAAVPGAARLEEALRQALTARDDAMVCVRLGGCELRRFADALHVVRGSAAVDAGFVRSWHGERKLRLPELGGTLVMTKCRGSGISLSRLAAGQVTVRVRGGGERLQPDCARPRRSLRNLLQEAGVPPWRREALPILYCGQQPVWMPGIGVDCGFQAGAEEAGIMPQWREGIA